MKKIALLVFFATNFLLLTAQDYSGFADIKFKNAEECRNYNPKALETSNYILSTPVNASVENRRNAFTFILNWMSSTADFTFQLDAKVAEMGKKEELLLGVYLASLTKFALENKEKAKDEKELKLGAMHLFATYCADEANKVTLTKQLKKLIAADKEGKLKEHLNL